MGVFDIAKKVWDYTPAGLVYNAFTHKGGGPEPELVHDTVLGHDTDYTTWWVVGGVAASVVVAIGLMLYL